MMLPGLIIIVIPLPANVLDSASTSKLICIIAHARPWLDVAWTEWAARGSAAGAQMPGDTSV
jgi:hypothetical protein